MGERQKFRRAALILLFALFVFAPLIPSVAQAAVISATVTAVKDTIISIDAPEKNLNEGELYYAINAKKIRTAVIKITDVGPGSFAQGRLLKGLVNVGERLLKRRPPAARGTTAPAADTPVNYSDDEKPPSPKWLRIGLGGSSFNFRGSSFGSAKSVVGFSLAALGELKLGSVTTESGLLYYQAGASVDASTGVTSTLTIDYLGIPLLAKAQVYTQPDYNFRLKGGLMLGYALSAHYRLTNGNQTVDGSPDVSDKLDYLAVFGGEFNYKFSDGEVFWFDLVYDYGVKQYNSGSSSAGGSSTAANTGFVFLIGMLF